jgi:hypothetical protein
MGRENNALVGGTGGENRGAITLADLAELAPKTAPPPGYHCAAELAAATRMPIKTIRELLKKRGARPTTVLVDRHHTRYYRLDDVWRALKNN